MRRSAQRFLLALVVAAVALSPTIAQVKDWRAIKYPRLGEFAIPKPEVFTLSNGMTVFLMEDREVPLIDVSARIRTGSYYEPAEKTGLASLMGTVQRTGGTARMTGDQIDDFLAMRAASIETSMGGDSAFASMNCLKEDFDDVLKIFVDILREPAFAQEKLEVAKVQSNTSIARRNDSVNAIASRETSRLIYGPDSPMGRMEEYATIASVTRDDLVAWHKKFYHPNNVYLGVVGDFDSKTMRRKIEDAFGPWPKGPAFAEPDPSYRKQPQAGVFFIEKSDVNQANIALGHLGIVTRDTLVPPQGSKVGDWYAVQVMNEVFGGGFASRLFSNVRSKKGLAYNVSGGLGSNFTRHGIFRVGLQTKSASMSEAVGALKEEIRSIIENPPDDAELKKGKESILNSFVFNYDSKEKVLRQQMTYAYYGMPADFLEQYRANIEKVTKEDVARVAEKYLRPNDLTLLVVGKAVDFDKPLDTFGSVTKLDITIPAPPDTSPKVAKTAAGLEAGKKVFSRMVAALGGANPGSVNAIQSSATMQISMGGQSMSLGRTELLVFPDKMRQTMKTPMGEQVTVVSGSEGFMTMGGQSRPIPSERLQERTKELGRDLRFLVRYHDEPGLEAVAAGQEEVNGSPCDVVAVTFRGAESRLCVAPDGTVLKQAYQGKNPMTQVPGQMEEYLSDYREVNGMKVPHKRVIRIDGQDAFTFTLESFEVNPKVEMSWFEKPAA